MGDASSYVLRVNWQRTDSRYARAADLVTASADAHITSRWKLFGNMQYDRLLRLTQQASGGIHYAHPCWDVSLEGYRTNLNGSSANSDIGFRFLLGFKGLGSVGS